MRRAGTFLALALLAAWAAAQDNGADYLMGAASSGSMADVRAELKRGADVNARDDDGQTALMYAVNFGWPTVAAFLLAHGADVDLANRRGETALIYAALKDQPACAKLLLDKGAHIDAKNMFGETPLMVAAGHGSTDTAKLLLDRGAEVNAHNDAGSTALMAAALNGRLEAARLLIDSGADVNARDNEGGTALITAAYKGWSGIIELLLEKGADARAVDNHTETALGYAKSTGHAEAQRLLEAALAEPASVREAREQAQRRQQLAEEAARKRAAALEERRRRAQEASERRLWTAAAAAVPVVLLAGAGLAWRQRKKAAADKSRAIELVRGLMWGDPERACEALREYDARYHDLSVVFSADDVLKVYEARDRARRPRSEASRRQAAQDGQREAAERVRALIEPDPHRAYEALRAYERDHGLCAFSGAELARLWELCGREGELTSGQVKLSERQALGAASYLCGRGRHEAALRFISAEPRLSSTIRVEDGCDEVIAIFERAGALERLFELCAAKTRDFQLAYAKSFLLCGRARDSLRVLSSVRVKERDGRALNAAALAADGRVEEALRSLSEAPKPAWAFEEWSAYFQICLKDGRFGELDEAYDRLKRLQPVRREPKTYYTLAAGCEAAGRRELAGEIFDAFVRAELPYKDAFERSARLDGRRHAEARSERVHAKGITPEPYAEPSRARVGGRYELRARLGEGGLGAVYAAYDRTIDRKAAVKKIRAEISGNATERARFLHEAKLVSHLSHPAIVGVKDIVEDGGDVYLVFDFVEGTLLSKTLEDKKRLPLKDCKTVLERVCQALDHAHLRNVVHRDLKPANVVAGADGLARVMDFGLCPITPAYAAPEQHAGAAQKASDVYALGVCLYEMTTGRRPFAGPDFAAQKLAKAWPPPRSLAPGLPHEFDALIAAALEPDPKNRIGDAMEFLLELKRLG